MELSRGAKQGLASPSDEIEGRVNLLCTFHSDHGLRTPNEGINQRYLKNWADVADKICCRHTKKFGSGSEFSAVQ